MSDASALGPAGRPLERPRLHRSEPVCVVVAAGGFGKSTLAAELARTYELATVNVHAAPAPQAFVSTLVEAIRHAGLSDLAAATAAAADVEAVAAAIEASNTPLCVVVDEIGRLDDGAALRRFAEALPAGCRAVFVGRSLPDGFGAMPDWWATLGADDLRFDHDEVAALVAATPAGSGPSAAEVLLHTDGWPLAVSLLVRHSSAVELDGFAAPRRPERVVGALLTTLLDELPAGDRLGVTQLAALPMVSREVAVAIGHPTALERAAAAGLPITRRPDGWFGLPDPIREAIDAPLPTTAQARAVAAIYAAAGQLSAAVALLHRSHDREGIAVVLGDVPWSDLQAAGAPFVRMVARLVPSGAVTLLVDLARAAAGSDPALRDEILAIADRQTAEADGPERRLVLAELAVAAAFRGELDTAEARAGEALAVADLEPATRARALFASGVAATIRATPSALVMATRALGESAALAELVGEHRWRADALLRLGYSVEFHAGRIDVALAAVEAALALAPAATTARALMLTYLADVLDFAGRTVDVEATLAESATIAARVGDERLDGALAWARFQAAAHAGDGAATRRRVDEALAGSGPWLDSAGGVELRLAAADALLSVGDEARALPIIDDARQRAELHGLADAFTPLHARHLAMFGDPVEAERVLAELDGRPFAVLRARWTRALFRSFAAHRRGDLDAARAHRRSALDEAARCGYPDLPARHERWIDERLRVYDGAGSPDDDTAGAATLELRLLGAFSLHAAGIDVTPPSGNPAAMVKLLALRGALSTEELIDSLWPEADTTTGRARLRNTLHRLRLQSGPVVLRRGELVELATTVSVDATTFEHAVEQVAAAPPHQRAGLARRAAALYRGELLPGDRYDDWAAAPRERLRRRYLATLDVLADDGEARGEYDEAVRQLDEAMRVDPLDDRYPRRAARLLVAQGRRAAAREVVGRAVAVAEDLGIAPDDELVALAAELGAG